jgi:hypothetical protein
MKALSTCSTPPAFDLLRLVLRSRAPFDDLTAALDRVDRASFGIKL